MMRGALAGALVLLLAMPALSLAAVTVVVREKGAMEGEEGVAAAEMQRFVFLLTGRAGAGGLGLLDAALPVARGEGRLGERERRGGEISW